MSNTWFTSDLHFDHVNILKHMPLRGEAFEDIHEMEECFINTINDLVKPRDRLIIAGDFCWRAGKAGHFRSRLKVREIQVAWGNHDAASLAKHVSRFEYMLFPRIDGKYFHVQHYSCTSWRRMQRGGIHCYGHSHGMFEEQLDDIWRYRNAMDIGIDNALQLTGEYRPFHYEEIIARCSYPSTRIDHP